MAAGSLGRSPRNGSHIRSSGASAAGEVRPWSRTKGYTKPLDSMCKKPEYYGIRRTAEAEALIVDKPGRKREANYKLSVRIPLGYVNMAEFRQQLIEMGYCNFTAWVLRCIRRQQEEYKKRKAPVRDGDPTTTTNIQDCGRNVKLKNGEVVEA